MAVCSMDWIEYKTELMCKSNLFAHFLPQLDVDPSNHQIAWGFQTFPLKLGQDLV